MLTSDKKNSSLEKMDLKSSVSHAAALRRIDSALWVSMKAKWTFESQKKYVEFLKSFLFSSTFDVDLFWLTVGKLWES